MKNVLVILAHPSIEVSIINRELQQAAQSLDHVTVVELYKEYPDFTINVQKEQQRLINSDVVVFLFPLYWYSTPPLLKQWQDSVLEYGFAYGSQGKVLHGKSLFCVTSTGSDEESYRSKTTGDIGMRELLLPIERMAQDTGMQYIEPLALHGTRTASEENRIKPHVARFVDTLHTLALYS